MPESQLGLNWFSKNLIEILPVAVYICDADASIVAFNRRATELWGRTPLLGQSEEKYCGSQKLYRPDGTALPHAETPMGWVLRTGKPSRDQEAIIERPDGSRVTVLVNIEPLFDDDGRQTGAVNCFQDLSARRESEAEREELQEALRQSQKMEAVGQLTGGLAHDFNNLLLGISGNLELLQTRVAQGRIKDIERYAVAALGAATRAAALTHRLLAFSRRQTLEAKTTDINLLIRGLEDLIRQTTGPNIDIEIVVADELWKSFVDPNQLDNALLNLCINARDALPLGGRITIETINKTIDDRSALKLDMPSGQYVTVSISDNGVGMAPEVASRAFEPFYTTKPLGMGTGLGLSMIYGFVRQSGGQVRIYSELGKGTMVCLYLPRKSGIEDEFELPLELIEAPQAASGTTVLVVDDEPAVRMLVTEILEDLGYIIVEAKDAAGGLRVMQSNARIDLLITDVGLPGGMNGRQLAEAARQHRPALKVLFITGYAETAMISHGHLDVGMHVMTKPFTIDALTAKVRNLIAGKPSGSSSS